MVALVCAGRDKEGSQRAVRRTDLLKALVDMHRAGRIKGADLPKAARVGAQGIVACMQQAACKAARPVTLFPHLPPGAAFHSA